MAVAIDLIPSFQIIETPRVAHILTADLEEVQTLEGHPEDILPTDADLLRHTTPAVAGHHLLDALHHAAIHQDILENRRVVRHTVGARHIHLPETALSHAHGHLSEGAL